MIAFSIWGIHIYWYGIFYLVSFVLAYFFLKWIWKKKIFSKYKNLQEVLDNSVEDLLIALILWVLIWWRLWEVFIYSWDYFSQNLLEIFAVWNWWMSFVWWFVWVALSIVIFCMIKKMSLDDFLLLACILITIAPIAIMLWRFWNYLNQELYWLVVAWDFRWLPSSVVSFLSTINIFHVYPNVDESLRVNTNFLSIIFEWFLIFLIVVSIFIKSIKRKNIKPYFILWVFFVMYSFARFMIEYLRIDSQSQYILMFTKSQRIFIVSFVIGVFMLMFSNRKELDLS